ncbi:MAG: methyltransferase domain-containing protein [Gammaproteobacteria bacterium]|nr:methyltransferase domain-containing protein [Gammaproteobacteria bacterium]
MKDKRPDTDKFDARLAAVYRERTDKQQHYDDWASSYDSDLVDDLDYVAWRAAGDLFAERVDARDQPILDVACGTGLVGEYLRDLGFDQIDGADFSGEMLAVAARRNVYRELWQHDFTRPRRPEPGYAALICVGMFSFTTPRISDLPHVVDCVRPGGLCVITVNGAAWRELDLETGARRAAAEHGFTITEMITIDYIREQDIDARVLVIRR